MWLAWMYSGHAARYTGTDLWYPFWGHEAGCLHHGQPGICKAMNETQLCLRWDNLFGKRAGVGGGVGTFVGRGKGRRAHVHAEPMG